MEAAAEGFLDFLALLTGVLLFRAVIPLRLMLREFLLPTLLFKVEDLGSMVALAFLVTPVVPGLLPFDKPD